MLAEVARATAQSADRHLRQSAASSPAPTSRSSSASARPTQAYELIRQGQQVLDKLEALPCATVAAINGFALGGGLEVALACRYRVLRRRSGRDARLPGSAARRASGIRRHRARRAARRPDRGDGPDADRPLDPAEAGARDGAGRSARAGRAARHDGEAGRAQPAAAAQPPSSMHRLLNSALVRPILAGQMRSQVAQARASRALPCPVRDDRAVAALRRQGRARVRSRSALDGGAAVHADLAQPGARVLPAGSAQVRRQGRRRARASTCTSSVRASWAETSRAGARRAA